LALWRRWWTVLRRGSRQIAHIHTCSGLSFFLDGALAFIARARGVPVVLHIHGGRFDTFLVGLDPLRRLLARSIARSAARVIVLSESWRGRLSVLLPGVHWEVVENGVPVPGATTAASARAEPIVVFVGAVCRAKGVEDLVHAVGRLNPAPRTVVIGPEAESGFVAAMQRLATETGVGERIEFVGPKIGEEKWAWLRAAQVFVLPSHAEALPISILEAMSVGCPVIATSVGAVPTVITDGDSGLLVAPHDVDGLAGALQRLLGDGPLRQQLGERGRQECAERFSIDKAVRKLHGIYAEIA
jgi:glycosyltransferase involved in cell wall biosynthesis